MNYLYHTPIPHAKVKEMILRFNKFHKFRYTHLPDNTYKWTGTRGLIVYKALNFCKCCSALWWEHFSTMLGWGDKQKSCPSCKNADATKMDIVFDHAPNC